MNKASVRLFIGSTVPIPVPGNIMEFLTSVKVHSTDEGRSYFEVSFELLKDKASFNNFSFLSGSLMDTLNRLIVMTKSSGGWKVIIDGIITDQNIEPSVDPANSVLTLSGEDISVVMDKEEVIKSHPAQNDFIITGKIILSYAKYGIIPKIIPTLSIDTPNPLERIPVQHSTDFEYLGTLAERHGYVFYVKPGSAPGLNIAYWGPPIRIGKPQKALSVDVGMETNVTDMKFRNNSQSSTIFEANFLDSLLGKVMSMKSLLPTRKALSNPTSILKTFSNSKSRIMKSIGGIDMNKAVEWTLGLMNKSLDDAVTARGSLKTSDYGEILIARDIVPIRGAGSTYNGMYHVKSVTHRIDVPNYTYTQDFELSRSGVGSLLSRVVA